jgi:hypothetical protein
LWRDTAAVTYDGRGHLYLGSMAGPVRDLAPRPLRVVRTLPAPRLSSHNYLVLTEGGLLLAAGDEAELAYDVRTGAQRWKVDLSNELFPEPCPFFVVAESVGRTYCGNYFGQMEERDLATGQRTGVALDPQLGSVGDLLSTGRRLVAFSAAAPVYSRWSLDGSGLAARLVAPDKVSTGGYDGTGTRLLVTPREAPDPATVIDLATRRTLWRAPGPSDVRWLGADTVSVQGPRVNGLATVPGRERPSGDGPTGPGRADVRPSKVLTADTQSIFPESDRRHAWAASAMSEEGRPVEVRRLDASSGRPTGERVVVPGYVQSVVTSPGAGSVLVTYGADSGWRTQLFDLPEGERGAAGLDRQSRTALAGDGTLVASDETGHVTQFDPATLAPVATLPGSRGGPSSLQFSADSSRLVVTTGDQSIQVYDVATRARLGDALPSAAMNGLTEGWLRPDGRAVAVNARQGVVEWTLDPRRLVRAACTLAGRNLTSTEWRTYVGAATYHATCPAYPSKPADS